MSSLEPGKNIFMDVFFKFACRKGNFVVLENVYYSKFSFPNAFQ